jgi:beta-lactamase regulating signal transducer with metallopeptidase domain/predicted  nucleic acid-binding Zn-ribbon protein
MDAMLLLKASVLLLTTLLTATLLGRAPAATRHRLWTLAFAAVLALPLLASALPAIHVPMPTGWVASSLATPPHGIDASPDLDGRLTAAHLAADSRAQEARASDGAIGPGVPPNGAPPGRKRTPVPATWPTASTLLLAAWLAGTTVAATRLLLSLARAGRLARRSEEMADVAWRAAADTIGARLGLRPLPVRLLVTPGVATPMAGGVRRPVIFLPASARAWSAEHRDVVLAHEMAHLAGRDPLRHLVARLAVALYWFHPLAWIAAWKAMIAREQACDEAVLALGTRPSAYARVLLELAESMPVASPALGALPMIERSLLETRVMTILNHVARPATKRRVLIPGTGALVLTVFFVAAAQPAMKGLASSVGVRVTAPPPSAASPTTLTAPAFTANIVAEASAPAAGQADVSREWACGWDLSGGSSFSGSISTTEAGGRTVIHEQIGTRDNSRVIQKSFGDLRVCMVASDVGEGDGVARPSQWLGRASRVVMEARRGSVVQRLELGRQAGGGHRTSWRVGSVERDFDAAAQQWRDRMLAVLDTTWELATLRGKVSSLRGEISSVRGQESSLRGEISSLRGEVSSMRGRASSVRGEESSLRGRISSIQGHVSSLHGAISSQQGAISSLTASRDQAAESERAGIATRIARHNAEIARLQQEIRDYNADAKIAAVQREIDALAADRQVAAIDAEIRAFDLEGKTAAVERRIAGLDVAGKIAGFERQIEALDADRRGHQLEERRDAEVTRLEAAIAAIR